MSDFVAILAVIEHAQYHGLRRRDGKLRIWFYPVEPVPHQLIHMWLDTPKGQGLALSRNLSALEDMGYVTCTVTATRPLREDVILPDGRVIEIIGFRGDIHAYYRIEPAGLRWLRSQQGARVASSKGDSINPMVVLDDTHRAIRDVLVHSDRRPLNQKQIICKLAGYAAVNRGRHAVSDALSDLHNLRQIEKPNGPNTHPWAITPLGREEHKKARSKSAR